MRGQIRGALVTVKLGYESQKARTLFEKKANQQWQQNWEAEVKEGPLFSIQWGVNLKRLYKKKKGYESYIATVQYTIH